MVPPGNQPIACSLEAQVMPDRLSEWRTVLAYAISRRRVGDGALRIEFADVPVAELARLVVAEQQCCAFLSFAITVDDRGVALEVRAPDDAAEIVAGLFGQPA